MKLRHNEETLSDRKLQYYLISGVVARNIGGLELQHRQKERVKWQERTIIISVSVGSFSKMSEVGVTAMRLTNLSKKRWNNIGIDQFIRKKV